ncbi:MAG: Bax inhibitor-1/YccA family protein [Planctomycetota bacterium]|jgi:FtsH-binding integral membrane protein
MRRFAESMSWAKDTGFAIDAAVNERTRFIRRTYVHLVGELGAVALVTVLVLQTPALQRIAVALWNNLLLYFAAVFGVTLLTRKLLEGRKSLAVQYAGAGIWVFFFGLLVAPLAMIAEAKFGSYEILGEGLILTGCVFGGLTAYTFFTKKDFSYLGGFLTVASWTLVGVVVILSFGGFAASPLWSILWVLLLAGWVLYDTSRVMHRRHVDEYVAASAELLFDFVYMFIHIVFLLMGSRD